MSDINEKPPLEISKQLKALSLDLDKKIPLKNLDKNLLIATWNIRAFGGLTRKWKATGDDSPKRDMYAIHCIAEILKRFDVIAIQEVKGNLRALRDTLKVLGSNWSIILTDVNRGSSGNGERMAYLFDTRRVQLSGLACELVVPNEWSKKIGEKALREQFVRSPYAVSFKSNNQTFILVTLHILYGKKSKDRIKELKAIAKWLADWAKDINVYHHNLIVLGDFNIEKRGGLLEKTFMSEGLFVPPELQNKEVTRSIFKETKYYDQIAWFNNSKKIPKLSMELMSAGSYDFVNSIVNKPLITDKNLSWKISDHYPLWAEFKL